MTIELHTETQTTAVELQGAVDRLDARRDDFNAAALAGTLSPAAVADLDGERNYARMRADAANEAAEAERKNLASPKVLAAAVKELETDPALSVDTLTESLDELRAALAKFETAAATRNESIAEWVRKLRALGVPSTGLHIDGRPIVLKGGGTVGNLRNGREVGSIAIGSSRVSVLTNTGSYVAGIVHHAVKDAHQKLDPTSLSNLDQRGTNARAALAITITEPVGNFNAGDKVTSYTHNRSALQHLVDAGYATDDNAPVEPELEEDSDLDDEEEDDSTADELRSVHFKGTKKHPGELVEAS